MSRLRRFFLFLVVVLSFLSPPAGFAHENYVLPQENIDRGMNDWSVNVFDALRDPHNLAISLSVAGILFVVFVLYYFFFSSKLGILIDRKVRRLEPIGHALLRIALGVSFLASAYFSSYLGPELPLSSLPLGALLRPVLFVTGVLLIFGFLTKIAGALGLITMLLSAVVYKDYMLSYLNYFGVCAAFFLFGSRAFSIDHYIFKTSSAFREKWREWELPLVRVTYGISILYPAIVVKLLHPSIILEIVEKYHMDQISWLFPSDPLLISLGTGLAQIVVGICIIVGFETRLNALATFVLYLLSVLFFQEAVWPHYILLALAFYLVVNDGGGWSVDGAIEKRGFKRLFLQKAAS